MSLSKLNKVKKLSNRAKEKYKIPQCNFEKIRTARQKSEEINFYEK